MPARAIIAIALMLALTAAPALAQNITKADWGTTSKGENVELFTLKGTGGLEAQISTFGATIVTLKASDRSGAKADVLLGYDDLAHYEKGGLYGAVLGRLAGLLSNNASFTLHGKTYVIDHVPGQNFSSHSGPHGFQKQVWKAVMHDGPEPSVTLTLFSPDGDGGFPGNLNASITYTVTKDNALKLDYRATTDASTMVEMTNHAYFNLGGEGSGDVLNARVQVLADKVTEIDKIGVPSGKYFPVAGTPLDLRKPKRVGDVVDSPFEQIANRQGLNINFVINGKPGTLRPAGRFIDLKSGRVMEILTTQPGMQIYSDNITKPEVGKGGHVYGNRNALCFETKHDPDAPNHPNFTSVEVTPGHPFHEVTEFKFTSR
jgi:aldose 1-epimerase